MKEKEIEEILNNKKFDVLEAFDKYFDIQCLLSEVLEKNTTSSSNISTRYHFVDPIDGKIFFDLTPRRDMMEENNKLILGKIPPYIIKAFKNYMLYVIYKNYDILNKLYLMRSNRYKTLMFDEILDTRKRLRLLVNVEAYYSNGILENKIYLYLVLPELNKISGLNIWRDIISLAKEDLEVAKKLGGYVTKITPKNIHWLASGKYILYPGIEEDMEEIDTEINQSVLKKIWKIWKKLILKSINV